MTLTDKLNAGIGKANTVALQIKREKIGESGRERGGGGTVAQYQGD